MKLVVEESGEITEHVFHRSCELSEEHFARWQIGKGLDLISADGLAIEDAALDHQGNVGLAVLLERFGNRRRVALRTVSLLADKGQRCRSNQQLIEFDSKLVRRKLDQRVLVDLVLAAGWREVRTQLRHGGHVQAAIFGEQDAVGGFELLLYLGDHCDLVCSWFSHVLTPSCFIRSGENRNGRPPKTRRTSETAHSGVLSDHLLGICAAGLSRIQLPPEVLGK